MMPRPADSCTGVVDAPIAVVGNGRLGRAMASALAEAGFAVTGPHSHGYDGTSTLDNPPVSGPAAAPATIGGPQPAGVVLLCVPDGAIAQAAATVRPGPIVAHCSGAANLSVLSPHRGFSLHPLMTVAAGPAATRTYSFAGVFAAVAGTDPGALALATAVAERLRMHPFVVAENQRSAYHAAAAFASNFLVTVEWAAGRLIESAGLDRSLLVPLARAALENWSELGAQALTGPVARGDHETVATHRAVVADRTADLLPLFDALVAATSNLAGTTLAGTSSLAGTANTEKAVAEGDLA